MNPAAEEDRTHGKIGPGAPRVAIVIVNWNGGADTPGCLESLKALAYSNYFVVVVDNASADGSAATLTTSYPELAFIQSPVNRGFAGGSNLGIRHAVESGADYVLLLNNDTRVDGMLLERLLRTAESGARIGLTGARIEHMSPPGKVWACGGAFDVNTGRARHFMTAAEFDAFPLRDGWFRYLPACAVLISRSCLADVGLLSERFFHLAEDVEFCVRAQNRGWSLALASDALVFHKGSASLERFSPLYNYYEQRNRLMVMEQYRLPRNSVCANLKDAIIILSRLTLTLATADRAGHLLRGAWFLILAVSDFARGRDGKREDPSADHTLSAVSQRRPRRRKGHL